MSVDSKEIAWRRKYIEQLSNTDFFDQSQQFLSRRRSLLGERTGSEPKHNNSESESLKTSASRRQPAQETASFANTGTDQLFGRSQEIDSLIEMIRSEFNTLPDARLSSLLKTLSASKNPIYKPLIHRLQVLAINRKAFRTLENDHPDYRWVFSLFSRMFTSEPTAAEATRDELSQRMKDDIQRTIILECIGLLKTQTPAIFELEKDWFESTLHDGKRTLFFGPNPMVPHRVFEVASILLVVFFLLVFFTVVGSQLKSKSPPADVTKKIDLKFPKEVDMQKILSEILKNKDTPER